MRYLILIADLAVAFGLLIVIAIGAYTGIAWITEHNRALTRPIVMEQAK